MKKIKIIIASIVLTMIVTSGTNGYAQCKLSMQQDSIEMLLKNGQTLIEKKMKRESTFRSNWIDDYLLHKIYTSSVSTLLSVNGIDTILHSLYQSGASDASYSFSTIDDVILFTRDYFKHHTRGISLMSDSDNIHITANLWNSKVKKTNGILGMLIPRKWNEKKVLYFDLKIEVSSSTLNMSYSCMASLNPQEQMPGKGGHEFGIALREIKNPQRIFVEDTQAYGENYAALVSFICKN